MLLNNRFKIFNKNGENINPIDRFNLYVTIMDPAETGSNGYVRAYVDYTGQLVHVEIVNPGFGYSSDAYLRFDTMVYPNTFVSTDSSLLVKGENGELISYTLPDLYDRFPAPTSYSFTNYYLPNVSTGLIESENLFIVEQVIDENGKEAYTYPRVESYGPFVFSSYVANGLSATLTIFSKDFVGYVDPNIPSVITQTPTIDSLSVGMLVTGTGVPVGTTIIGFTRYPDSTSDIFLSNSLTSSGRLSFVAHVEHNLQAGSEIVINNGSLAGTYLITQVSQYAISFDTSLIEAGGAGEYYVVPQFKASISSNSDPEFFLYTIQYNVDYPTIVKSQELTFQFTNPSLLDSPDTFSLGNGEYTRILHSSIESRAFQLNIGLQAEFEGVYDAVIQISDVSFATPKTILVAFIEGEVEGEDERLGLLLENFGRDVTQQEELIFRDSDINEDNVDYILLNKKRKEMLLQGDQIWPYVGSYRGLVNVINWFGYYDIRIKEYFLNVNTQDVYFNKYRQVQIPFQLAEKGIHPESTNLVPSQYYRKTGLFGLFYDIIKDSGEYDEYGIPVTEDAFAYTNDEVLVKLFSLKKFLKEKFLPLNTRIVDIAGEGVYYERYAVNSWSDRNDRILIDVGKRIDFIAPDSVQIVDARTYDSNGGVLSPEISDALNKNSAKYNFNSITIIDGGTIYGKIPKVVFPGNALQQALGTCGVSAASQSCSFGGASGAGYEVSDIITLEGGIYEIPIRLVVTSVDLSGGVMGVSINNPEYAGKNYTALPETFSQYSVMRPVGAQYEVPTGALGFEISSSIIFYTLSKVTLSNLGIGYTTVPKAQFIGVDFIAVDPSVTLNYTTALETPVSYFNNSIHVEKYPDAPGISVSAPLNLSTDFNLAWDELPYSWDTFTGSSDVNLKAWVNVLPSGNGELIAIEILSQGSDYTSAPSLSIQGGGGYGASAIAQTKEGKINIIEYTVTHVSSTAGATNDLIQVSPALVNIVTGSGNVPIVTPNHIVKGDAVSAIPDGTIVANIVVASNEIFLASYDEGLANTNIQVGDKIYIHQGVSVTANGSGFVSTPHININGGHTRISYTWDHIARGEFHEMEWKVQLTKPEDPKKSFFYATGVQTIDDLMNHTVFLPYVGKYTVQLDLIDTNNNISNKIKHDYVNVYMPEADFSFVSKSVDDGKSTWDDFHQIVESSYITQPVIRANTPIDAPEPTEYSWDNFDSRWINITNNQTKWDDCQINWETLHITDLSDVNYPKFPDVKQIEVLQVSSQDVYEGYVLNYTDSTTSPSSLDPTITLAGQFVYPKLNPSYDPTDWLFLRRGDNIFQVQVINANYTITGETIITLGSMPPSSFRKDPLTWEVLREIGSTVAVAGNQIYDVNTNPTGFVADDYLVLSKKGETPSIGKLTISAADSEGIKIKNGAAISALKKPGSIGKIYKIRDYHEENGALSWTLDSTSISEISIPDNGGGSDSEGIYANLYQSSTTGSGSNAVFTVELSGNNFSVTIVKSGIGYNIGDTITILGSVLGGNDGDNDLVMEVIGTGFSPYSSSSSWAFIGNTSENSSSQGQIVLNDYRITCDPLTEIAPGFTRIKLFAYDGAQLMYTQTFRTKHISYNTSNVGYAYDIWGGNTYVIDVIGVDGGALVNTDYFSLNDFLTDFASTATNPLIYLEYEYDIFTTRERFYSDVSSDEYLYLDYDNYPPTNDFIGSTNFGTYYDLTNSNWFYDHGFLGNTYSQKILNVGTWRDGSGTLLTLDDNNYELFRTDTNFLASQQEFDEDYAKRHLGTRSLNWNNYDEVSWNEFAGNSWDTLDYTEELGCEYVIKTVAENGTIKFNEDEIFIFTSVNDSTTDARKIASAVQDLSNSDNSGISRFTYEPTSVFPAIQSTSYTLPCGINGYAVNKIKKGPDGNIWAILEIGDTACGTGIYYYDGLAWTELALTNPSTDHEWVDFGWTSTNQLIAITRHNIYTSSANIYNSLQQQLYFPGLHTSLMIDTVDHLWVGSNIGLNLYQIDTEGGSIFTTTGLSGTPDNHNYGIVQDTSNNLVWVLTETSISYFVWDSDPDYVTFVDYFIVPSGVPSERCLSLYPGTLDPVFTTTTGVYIYSISLADLGNSYYTHIPDSISGRALHIDSAGNILVAFQSVEKIVLEPVYNDDLSLYDYTVIQNSIYQNSLGFSSSNMTAFFFDESAQTTWVADYTTKIWSFRYTISNEAPYFGKTGLDTFNHPSSIFISDYELSELGDAFYGFFVDIDSYIISLTPTSIPGYSYQAVLSNPIPKKASFSADSYNPNILKNVLGLAETDLRVGDKISGDNISYVATVMELVKANGMIKEIIIDIPFEYESIFGNFYVEWYTIESAKLTIPWLWNGIDMSQSVIYASAKNPSVENLGYLEGGYGVEFLIPQDENSIYENYASTSSHTFPMNHFYKWIGYGIGKVGSFEYGLQQFLQQYRYAQVYYDIGGISPLGVPGWYPAETLPLTYSYIDSDVFDNSKAAKVDSNRLPFERSIGGAYTWEETKIGIHQGKLPVGSSVLLSSDASAIAGKSQFLWKIIEDGVVLVETTNSQLLWTFGYTGEFDVELTIFDSNGNSRSTTKNSFLIVYASMM